MHACPNSRISTLPCFAGASAPPLGYLVAACGGHLSMWRVRQRHGC